jgi:pseudoazurin
MDTHLPTRRNLLVAGAAALVAAPFAPLMAQTAGVASESVASTAAAADAQPAVAVVQMLNKSPTDPKKIMVFEPHLVRIPVGGTVRFEATDPGHNAVSMKGMTPEGAEEVKTPLGKTTEVVFAQEGVYGIGCTPHQSMGMVALVVVGEPVNLEAAKAVKHRGKTKDTFEAIFAELDTLLAAG